MKTVHITQRNFNAEVARSPIPVVLDLWAPWCGPCRSIAPLLDELAAAYDGRVKLAKINVDDEPELAAAFRVQGIPTVLGVAGGQVVEEQIGFRGRAPLAAMFEKLAKRAVVQPGATP